MGTFHVFSIFLDVSCVELLVLQEANIQCRGGIMAQQLYHRWAVDHD